MTLREQLFLIEGTHPTLTNTFKALLPEINKVITFTDKSSEKYYAVMNNIYHQPTCKYCDKPKTYYNIKLGYANTCGSKSCAAYYSFDIHPELRENISKSVTGRKHSEASKRLMSKKSLIYNNDEKKKQKTIDTCIEKYGVSNPFQLEEVKEQSKQTMLIKYGVEYNMQREEMKKYLSSSDRRLSYELSGRWIPLNQKEDFAHYRLLVEQVTRLQDINQLQNSENRGRGIDNYHLDHKYSIKQGFIEGIIPHIIGNINNLEFITCSENTSKWSKCSITKSELYQSV